MPKCKVCDDEAMFTPLWKLPVPSTSLLEDAELASPGGRQLELRMRYEATNVDIELKLVFRGVEAYKVTYLYAQTDEMLGAYDQLVDVGPSAWRAEVESNLKRKRNAARVDPAVRHLMINFDDGPCYEVLCRFFEETRQSLKRCPSV